MDHDILLKYVQTLGIPVCTTIACGYALWLLGNRLIESHFNFIGTVKAQGDQALQELRIQTELLRKWPSDFNDICKASECKSQENQHPAVKGGKNAH